MRLPFLHIISIILLSLSCMSCDNDHGNFSFFYQGTKYEIVKDKKTWPEAAAYAAKRGARLVEIKSEGMQFAIYKALVQGACVSPAYTSVKDGGGVAYLWIGATDRSREGQWLWDGTNSGKGELFYTGQGSNGKGDGKLIGAYANWGGCSTGSFHEPDDYEGRQDAAAIALQAWPAGQGTLGHAGEWNDLDENNKLYFIIEYSKP